MANVHEATLEVRLTRPAMHVDLTAIAANYRDIQARAAPALVAAVVKADAYGLGARRVVEALKREGCSHFFVATLEEAQHLDGIVDKVDALYVLNGLLPGTEEDCLACGAIPVINSRDQLESWALIASAKGLRLPAAIQIDTGMTRLGFSREELAAIQSVDHIASAIEIKLIISHLACADNPAAQFNQTQFALFQALSEQFPGVPRSLDNSAGTFMDWDHLDIVRTGIALYGGRAVAGRPALRTVLTIEAPITQIRDVIAGQGVGYSLSFHTQRQTRIATLPIGYADGWPRALGNHGFVYIGGTKAPIVGFVSMDSMTVDVTDVPAQYIYPGSPAQIIGRHQSVDEVAAECGRIPYEILVGIGSRYIKTYS